MKSYILKLFAFIKSFLQFLQIVVLFFVLIHILYWIEHLIGTSWNFLNIFKPFLDIFINMGRGFSSGEINLFAARFEFCYAIAVILYVICYYAVKGLIFVVNFCEDIYNKTDETIRRIEENTYNEAMEAEQKNKGAEIKKYKIYIATSVKQQNPNFKTVFDIDKYNVDMNKFLIKNTSSIPTEYEQGYLYSFNSFGNIDKILDVFSQVFATDAPVNHVICVQIYGQNVRENTLQLQQLIKLNFTNKIYTMADTVWRYKFNNIQTYSLSMLGAYQSQDETFDVYQFVKNQTF